MDVAEKIIRAKEDIDEVYEAGQVSMIDKSKIIEKTVSGNYISVDDVSEIPHGVACKISGVDNPETVQVKRCGKNFLKSLANKKYSKGLTYTVDEYGVITVSGTISNENQAYSYAQLYPSSGCIVGKVTISGLTTSETGVTLIVSVKKGDGNIQYYYARNEKGTTFDCEAGDKITAVEIRINKSAGTVVENLIIKPQLEFGAIATEYEPYKGETFTPNEDGTVEGMTSISPYMNIFTDNAGATFEVTYRMSWGMQEERERFYNDFQQGKINVSISFEWLALDKANTTSVINALSATTTGQTLTLNLSAVNAAFETSSGAKDGSTSTEFAALIATKTNWTIILK